MGTRIKISILMFLSVAALSACRHAQVKSTEAAPPWPSGPVVANPITEMENKISAQAIASPSPTATPTVAGLDLESVTKARSVFGPLAAGDDKKAKLAYGRASRHLPSLVQFAVDLRFQNYEHAMSLLEKLPMKETQKSFWRAVIEKKPKRLAKSVCDRINDSKEYPLEEAHIIYEDAAWDDIFKDVVAKLAEADKRIETNTSFDEKLSGFHGQLTGEQQKDLLDDSFFDKLHNAKRRDTRYVRNNFKNAVKLMGYRDQAAIKELKNLLLFYRSLSATTENPKQMHFLRRFKGIGRDMKSESLLNRALGDVFTEDKKDQDFTYVLLRFKDENLLVSDLTGLDYELAASCAQK